MKKDEPKSRNFSFTINNYTKEDLIRLKELGESFEKHKYLILGLELAPETGTKHIQGYIQLNTAQRYSFLQKYFNLKRGDKIFKFHIEISNGTPKQNIDYCKKDGDSYEFGEPQTQGERTDLKDIKEKIKENPKNLNQIIDEHGNNYQQLKYAESLPKYYLAKRNPDTPPTVYWIFGSTGIGKTRLVSRTFDDICYVSTYKWLGTDYNQNECFFLDDFREFDLPFNIILKITDRYPFTLEYKGSQIPLNSPFIVFTSPKSIEETFGATKENIKQLKRRVIEIDLDSIDNIDEIDLKNLNEKYIYKPVNNDEDVF